MALEITHKYDDIIDLPHPVSQRRIRMTNYDRAAQFSPFAALTGFDATIEEAGRLTDTRVELEEGERERLNAMLQQLQQNLPDRSGIVVTYFVYDSVKSGGAYITVQGYVKKIDAHRGEVFLTDGTVIPIQEIIALHTAAEK